MIFAIGLWTGVMLTLATQWIIDKLIEKEQKEAGK